MSDNNLPNPNLTGGTPNLTGSTPNLPLPNDAGIMTDVENQALQAAVQAGISAPSAISSTDPAVSPEATLLEMRVARLEKLVEYFYATYHRNTDIDEIAR